MTQLASAMIAMVSSAVAVNLRVGQNVFDKWSTADPYVGPGDTWHIAGPFDQEFTCDYDRNIGLENNLSCDFKGIELKGTLEYKGGKWQTSGVKGTRQEHATQTTALTVKMDFNF